MKRGEGHRLQFLGVMIGIFLMNKMTTAIPGTAVSKEHAYPRGTASTAYASKPGSNQ